MNLLQIRNQFRTQSGRFDLVDPAGKNMGADFFINAGIRYLDRKIDEKKLAGRLFRLAAAGSYQQTFQRARAIQEVWAANATSKWKLTKVQPTEMYTLFAQAWQDQESSSDGPQYYAPCILRSIPETLTQQDLTALGFITKYMDVMTAAQSSYNGIIYAPKPASECMIEIVGTFYSQELSVDTDENFWTVVHPELVIMAALLETEVVYRNRQGVDDMAKAIDLHLFDIDKDFVDEISADVTRIRG